MSVAAMNSDSIFRAIEKIAATASKNEKQELVKQYGAMPGFLDVLKAALDPFATYGIANVPPKTPGIAPGLNTFSDSPVWQVLEDLKTRKLTGNAAREEVQKWIDFLTEESSELFRRILKKDLRAGFGESTVNKVFKGTIPEFTYMRCSLPKDAKLDEFTWATGVISQEKADGMFMNIDVEKDDVRLTSRQGTPFPNEPFEALIQQLASIIPNGHQLHGEMLVFDKEGKVLPRAEGNGVLNSIAQGGTFEDGQYPVYYAWDMIPLSSVTKKGKYNVGYKQRLTALITILKDSRATHLKVIPTRIVRSLDEAYAHYRELLKQGKEGTIIKNGTAIWKDGTSKEQVKLKLEVEVELRVVGFEEGTGKYEGQLGALICESLDGKLRVKVSGRGDAMRAEVWANKDDWFGAIVTVKGNELLAPSESNEFWTLFLPIFIERRTDKSKADSLERIQAQFDAAKGN